MEFEYDPGKSETNKVKHGLDFEEAQALWADPRLLEAPARTEDEPRFVSVGKIDGRHWAAVWTPAGRWVDLDPTNAQFADSRYIVTAWGRDFRDVSPLKGVIYTESKKSKLEVKVDVFRVNADGTLTFTPATSCCLTTTGLASSISVLSV